MKEFLINFVFFILIMILIKIYNHFYGFEETCLVCAGLILSFCFEISQKLKS